MHVEQSIVANWSLQICAETADNASRTGRASETTLVTRTGTSPLTHLPRVVTKKACWALIRYEGSSNAPGHIDQDKC